ncbi:MAG: SUMF1/EgtB/PvdO family nonheme iron enzyme [Anaerolineae bacterium]|uniref:SUMF1/EgtB/PvdO family nonheme iron enzyme n=1 Tax=Candidatus Amarolinea dominans TaxID=3140696 RepID=UPI0031374F53|nr:SUMF1/EgtB/PvdO family nonheme iron enzyme [Anaerolineae bacterium]
MEQNPALARLVAIPLWLTLTASLFYTNDLRPFVSKPEIYRLCIVNLLHRRRKITNQTNQTNQTDQADQTDQHLLLLAEIAWEIHNSPNTTLSRKQVEAIVQRVTNREPGGQFPTRPTVDQLESDWGILIQRSQSRQYGDVYGFAQQGFQDYLVALAARESPKDHWPVMKAHLMENRWREVALLYTAMATNSEGNEPWKQVLDALMPDNRDAEPGGRTALIGLCLANAPAGKMGDYERVLNQLKYVIESSKDEQVVSQSLEALVLIVPAGRDRALEWMKRKVIDTGFDLLPKSVLTLGAEAKQVLRTRLIEQIGASEKIQDRILAARLLAQIGDTRIGNTAPMSNPAMTADHGRIMQRAAIYPVTNAEYALFVQASHRTPPRQWPEGRFRPPEANYPVTNVSFDDAQAYCDWLSENSDHRVFLPTNEQWTTLAGDTHERFHGVMISLLIMLIFAITAPAPHLLVSSMRVRVNSASWI